MVIHRKILGFLIVPFLLMGLSLLAAKPVDAAEFHFKGYTLAQDQTVNDDVYVSGDTADIKGVINGDLFVCAESVTISGTVSGDIYTVGSKVTFEGNSYGNVYMLGNNLNLEGSIKGNLYTMAAMINSSVAVEKDFTNISQDGTLKGSVADDTRVIANNISIDTVIGGDLISIARIDDVEKGNVSGNIYNWGTIKGLAKAQGVDLDAEKPNIEVSTSQRVSANLLTGLISFIGLGLAGYFLITLSPVKTGKIVSKISGSVGDFFKSLGIGFLIAALIPIPLLLLFVSIFGTYLGLLISGLLLFLCVFGRIWTEVALGKEILSLCKVKGYRPFKSLLIGRVISVAIAFAPIVGAIYSLVLTLTSLGAFVRVKFDYWNISKKK